MSEKLVAIGHVTEDIATPENMIGGGVFYTGVTAERQGLDVEIYTKIPHGHRFIDMFSQYGITVIAFPTQIENITMFDNQYDSKGARQQILQGRQEPITLDEVKTVPATKLDARYLLVAPVINEVDMGILPLLAQHGSVVVSPQGYFRETGDNNVIYQKEWRGFETNLSYATITVLSNDDISTRGVLNESLLNRIASCSPVTVLTEGPRGSTVFIQGKKAFKVNAFDLQTDEVNERTGSGDTYTGALIAKLAKGDIYEAAVFASLIAAVKISGVAGTGINSIPNKQQVEQFLEHHQRELKRFLHSNQVGSSAISL